MTTIRDSTMDDILEFLDSADQHGKEIYTMTGPDIRNPFSNNADEPKHTISFEVRGVVECERQPPTHRVTRVDCPLSQARVLKRMFLKLRS
ncbi:hypothetical protein PINS_up023068 [Pythium insidiosum]|nr:hypothetical protein PINS_up005957 [Pythium insidiosum]GLE10817.1 hypothetical protein PINS_up023068 [Pythium insidiosum]